MAPPLDYLCSASRSSLQSFELAHLNHASNLRREIAVLIDQWIEETAEALLARCLIDHFPSLNRPAAPAYELAPASDDAPTDLLPAPWGRFDAASDVRPAEPRYAVPTERLTGTLSRKPRK